MWGKTWIAFTCLYKRPQSGKLSDSSRESADAAHLYLTTRGRCHETSLPAAQYLPGAPLKLAKPHITYSMGCPNLRKLPPDWPDWFPSTVQTINGWSIPFRFALLEAGSCPPPCWVLPQVTTRPQGHTLSRAHRGHKDWRIRKCFIHLHSSSFIFIHLPLDSVELMVKLRLRFCCLMLWRSKRTEMWRINTNVVKPPWSPSFLRLKHTFKSTAQILHTINPIN